MMINIALLCLGVCLGSFVNALVWRLHEQEELRDKKSKTAKKRMEQLSITRGRSMCTNCGHVLAPKDLVPVLSWVWLRGKCRYCKGPINDTPFTELTLPVLFVVSYIAWPYALSNSWLVAAFASWLGLLTVFLALAVYDARWYLLPDKLVGVASVLSFVMMCLLSVGLRDVAILRDALLAGGLLFGFLYMLFIISKETWMGGGDVKLAFCLGLVAGTPLRAGLVLFFASLTGTIAALPGIITRKRSIKSTIPFGPWLLIAAVIVFLWGNSIITWYQSLLGL